jgi:hypothetical protein
MTNAGSSDRLHQNLLGKFAADGHPGSANRANQIPASREFADLELLAKPEIAQAVTARTIENPDLHVTTHPDLIQGHGAVDFQIGCKCVWHLAGKRRQLRLTCNNKSGIFTSDPQSQAEAFLAIADAALDLRKLIVLLRLLL